MCELTAAVILVLLPLSMICKAQDHQINAALDEIASMGKNVPASKMEAARNMIEANPDKILPLLLRRVKEKNLSEANLATYIWAIGLTKSQSAVDEIIRLSAGKKSDLLVFNVYQALASIGGTKASEHLFRALKESSTSEQRFKLLDLLAQLQYPPALPETAEILKLDPKSNWRALFVFGKYGDLAIPFLLEKLSDKEQNVRSNALNVLGHFLIATEAVTAMKKQFWTENDQMTRITILSALEKINDNLEDVRVFSEEVVQRDKNSAAGKFASETIENMEEMANHFKSFKAKKRDDRILFESEYKQLLDSYGNKGSFDNLEATSVKTDEAKLKKLRETILQRNSDECLYEYRKLNNIIIMNRRM